MLPYVADRSLPNLPRIRSHLIHQHDHSLANEGEMRKEVFNERFHDKFLP